MESMIEKTGGKPTAVTAALSSEPASNLWDYKHDKDKRYYDLMAYIVSNAVAGEIMAVENYSEMVQLMPDTESKIETVKQATEEAKHIRMLASLGRRLEYNVEQRIVEPQWHAIRRHFSEAVHKKDLAACLISQDLMTETMAIVLYKILSRDTDADTSHVTSTILQDELEHLDIGVNRIQGMLAQDPASVHDSLVWAHHRVMPELFSMISTSCHSLCDEVGVECGSLTLKSIHTDIESIRLDALDAYMETLDRVGFAVKVTSPLIASMSSYGVTPRADLRLRSDSCSPGAGCC
jgi:fatty aldehyde decarbonylase